MLFNLHKPIRLYIAAARSPPLSEPANIKLRRLCRDRHSRRNYLFAGADSGGERAAAIYSLVGTAKLNGIDPQAYLRYVLARIADHAIDRIDELVPWVVAAQLRIAV